MMARMKWLWGRVLELMYPNFCLFCEATLSYGYDRGVCPTCLLSYPHLEEDLCSQCGKPLVDVDQMKCFDCSKQEHLFIEGGSLWVYEGLVKQAIYDYKYKYKKEFGVLFAKEVVRYYNETKMWSVDMVIPVPLFKKRQRERGFNQAEVIASILSKSLGLNTFEPKALWRQKSTIPQKDLSDTDRRMNVENAFCADGTKVKGQKILLIDDIYTTGSTINACTNALLEVGAEEVYYMAIAIGRGF